MLNVRKQSGPMLKDLTILLYGMPKVGKTTQAAKFPGAILLNCEPGGTDLLAGEHEVADIQTLDHLEKALPSLMQSDYKTIVLDGFTWLVNDAARRKVKEMGATRRLPAYALITEQVSRILGDLLRSGKIIIATGHSRIIDAEDEAETSPAQRNAPPNDKLEVRPDINPRLSDGVFGLFSIIGYCFPSDSGSKMLTKPQDNAKRRILAGDRSGILPTVMPLDADAIMQALKQAAQPKPDRQPAAPPAEPEAQAA